jgi:crotonobetainyl-CoA:carnitine CoA-transferase CaiB-like acyl-CoA transferase
MIQTVQHPGAGPVKVLGVPVKLSATPGAVNAPPPRLGEHTASVLKDMLGVAPEAIAQLAGEGVIALATQAE